MKQRALAVVLTAAMAFGTAAPALADGAASTRNIILFSVAGVFLVTTYARNERKRREERQAVERRQDAYRDWFYHKYGYYPTYDQFKAWYIQTYNSNPG
ncbi:MAG: hypothetical protein JOY69_09945 [Candidatus Eremiobacteraeota bacterium]|nr:hypothetical protein [Candidatus Eremiobacteraeota bacterium]